MAVRNAIPLGAAVFLSISGKSREVDRLLKTPIEGVKKVQFNVDEG
jgi:hypothetical protein